MVLGQVFLNRDSTFPCRYHSTIGPYSFRLHIALIGNTSGPSLVSFKQNTALSDTGESFTRNYLQLFLAPKGLVLMVNNKRCALLFSDFLSINGCALVCYIRNKHIVMFDGRKQEYFSNKSVRCKITPI